MRDLTARYVETVKAPAGKRLEIRDGKCAGLVLRVTPDSERTRAVKSWALLYRRQSDGKRRRLTLGTYPDVDLSEARLRVGEARTAVGRGEDPAAEKQGRRKGLTFQGLAEQWLEVHGKQNKRERSRREDERILKADVYPAIGDMPATAVMRSDIITLLNKVAARGAPVAANRTQAVVTAIFNWAVEEDLLKASPALRIRKRAKEQARERTLDDDEIKQFWAKLDTAAMDEKVKNALRLALVTGQRIGEITGMHCDELDSDKRLWEIPGTRTKNGKAHVVPLSEKAWEIIESQVGEITGDDGETESKFVFPGKRQAALNSSAPNRALARCADHFEIARFTAHDLRRTAGTGMAAAGIDRSTIGFVLNHTTGGEAAATRIYDKYERLSEKRAALERWAGRLGRIIKGDTGEDNNVVPIKA